MVLSDGRGKLARVIPYVLGGKATTGSQTGVYIIEDAFIAAATTSAAGAAVVAAWRAMRRALPAEAWRMLTEEYVVAGEDLFDGSRPQHVHYSSSSSNGSSRDGSACIGITIRSTVRTYSSNTSSSLR